MKIIFKPQEFKGDTSWQSKLYGVVLVEKKEDVELLWKLLYEQDDYWEHYKHLIQIAPKEVESREDISKMCAYVGKTDIYNVQELKEKIDFIIYQEICDNF